MIENTKGIQVKVEKTLIRAISDSYHETSLLIAQVDHGRAQFNAFSR